MIQHILRHLHIEKAPPSINYLKQLITAYCKNVPWESASKIIKQQLCNSVNCTRLQDEFWNDTIQYGAGGTCYESNWAFYYLLQQLGFTGYLTINKIVDKSSVHAAIVIQLNNIKYIVDIGYPVYAPIKIIHDATTITHAHEVTYSAVSITANEYIIENTPHPKPYLYHLTNVPVPHEEYLKIAADDYREAGLFSDRIVIRKIVNGLPARFDSADLPYNIHTLHNGIKQKTIIEPQYLVSKLSNYFAIHADIIAQAFSILNKMP